MKLRVSPGRSVACLHRCRRRLSETGERLGGIGHGTELPPALDAHPATHQLTSKLLSDEMRSWPTLLLFGLTHNAQRSSMSARLAKSSSLNHPKARIQRRTRAPNITHQPTDIQAHLEAGGYSRRGSSHATTTIIFCSNEPYILFLCVFESKQQQIEKIYVIYANSISNMELQSAPQSAAIRSMRRLGSHRVTGYHHHLLANTCRYAHMEQIMRRLFVHICA